jgi:hypothetical protein
MVWDNIDDTLQYMYSDISKSERVYMEAVPAVRFEYHRTHNETQSEDSLVDDGPKWEMIDQSKRKTKRFMMNYIKAKICQSEMSNKNMSREEYIQSYSKRERRKHALYAKILRYHDIN